MKRTGARREGGGEGTISLPSSPIDDSKSDRWPDATGREWCLNYWVGGERGDELETSASGGWYMYL